MFFFSNLLLSVLIKICYPHFFIAPYDNGSPYTVTFLCSKTAFVVSTVGLNGNFNGNQVRQLCFVAFKYSKSPWCKLLYELSLKEISQN